ncbi:QPCT (predicted) [Pycnogonum litorale]
MNFLWSVACLLIHCATDTLPTRFDHERSLHEMSPLNGKSVHHLTSLDKFTELYHDLKHILIPRIPGSPGHKQVAKFITDKMRSLNWHVEQDKFIAHTPKGAVHMRNIIATLNPDAPRRLVLACHYDSKIMRELFYAATDSAVPCTLMLNIAETLDELLHKHRQNKHRYTLQFIFFDGEEAFVRWTSKDSLYGSRHLAGRWENEPYVENPNRADDTKQLHRIDVMVLLDLLGAKDPNIPSYFSSTKHLHSTLKEIERKLHLSGNLKNHKKSNLYFTSKRTFGGIDDDHKPFEEKGVPILHIIPHPFPRVWHTIEDDHRALDADTINNLARIFRIFVSVYLGLDRYIGNN